MDRNKIYLEALALEELLRASYETLDKECIGYLLGRISPRKTAIVESAHSLQIAERKPGSVSYIPNDPAYFSLTNNWVGDFHPHTNKYGGVIRLSKSDIESLSEESPQISLVIGLNNVKTCSRIKPSENLISGYLEIERKIVRFRIAGYYSEPGLVRRAIISAPKK